MVVDIQLCSQFLVGQLGLKYAELALGTFNGPDWTAISRKWHPQKVSPSLAPFIPYCHLTQVPDPKILKVLTLGFNGIYLLGPLRRVGRLLQNRCKVRLRRDISDSVLRLSWSNVSVVLLG